MGHDHDETADDSAEQLHYQTPYRSPSKQEIDQQLRLWAVDKAVAILSLPAVGANKTLTPSEASGAVVTIAATLMAYVDGSQK